MASPAKTSSSSLPCRTNPTMKKSEICDPMRRSFSGNPFSKPSIVTNPRAFNPSTPVNSPSDFPRRHSTGRESLASLRDSEKENGKDQNQKPTRIRSPAPSKGTKNFMSPTISAASKINASPRKKILGERNESSVRSSVSFSDVKSLIKEENESTPEIALKQKRVSFSDVKSVIMEGESTPEIGSNQKKVTFSDVRNIIMADNAPTPVISMNQKKVTFADKSTPQIVLKQNNDEVPHDSSSSNHEYEEPLKSNAGFEYKEFKHDSDLSLETVTDENDSVNVDPSFKISPRVPISPSCPVLAPLDTDPSVPPYDPKTNYLSPRPQFLHYRPNPRIGLYREREGMQLEEHFASESSYSDTDVTEETHSEASQRESEDISSEETVKEEEEEELRVSEPNPIALSMVEEGVEAKRMSKPRFSTRSKLIAFLLVLAFACFSIPVVNSPTFVPSALEELSLINFYVPPEVTEFAKANFDRFTQNLQHLSARFLSCVSNIISSSREGRRTVSFQYANLSHLLEDHNSEGHLMADLSVLDPVWGRSSGTELVVDDTYYREIEEDEAVEEDDKQEIEEQENQVSEAYENLELASGQEPDEVDHLEGEENKGVEVASQIDAEHQSNVNLNHQLSIIPQAAEVSKHDEVQKGMQAEMIEQAEENEGVEVASQIDAAHQSNMILNHQPSTIPRAAEVSKCGDTLGDNLNDVAEIVFANEEVMSQNPKIGASIDNFGSSEAVNSSINVPEDQLLTKNVMGFSLLVLCLLAATAFIFRKRGKHSMPNAAAVPVQPVQQPVLAKRSEYSPVSVNSNGTTHERLSSKNWQTEVDMSNESCPSEMSSCQKTSSSSLSKMGPKESNEHQSQERKPRQNYRRESLASSDYSMGSTSYGSFTTYEKITNKHGGGDEEIVTPVRRSSRIRKQVTSP